MKLVRRVLTLLLCAGAMAWAVPPRPAVPARPTLPVYFDGWQKAQSHIAADNSWQLPPSETAAMAEYGLQFVERDTYRRSGRQIQVQGYRFQDAGGAYGAFTFYRPENFHTLDWPRHGQAASGNMDILFTRGAWLVRVQMDELTAMTERQMRDLAQAIPASPVASEAMPDLPQYLPRDYQLRSSVHFALGPAAFAASCSWLAASAVGFDKSAETVLATYNLPNRPPGAQLLVISYPTPQMARTHEPQLAKVAGVWVRRSGPFLVLVHGLSQRQAAVLLQSVNYDADLTVVPPKYVGLEGVPGLILSIFVLCAFIIGISIVLGVITGWISATLDRWLPGGFRFLQPKSLIRLQLGRADGQLRAPVPGPRVND